MSILSIDQGTTSTRALLLKNSGIIKIVQTLKHRQFYSASGWVEHDPKELIHNIQTCIQTGIDQYDDIEAVGIDNQGESCLAWHADTKQAITPVIVWQDNRTQSVLDKLKSENMEAMVLEKAGLPLDSYFSAAKLAWIVKNIPQAQKLLNRGKLRLGTTDAFFLDCLTDRFVTDITTASRTSLMNLQRGQWDKDLCDLFGVPVQALPEIVSTTGDFGRIILKERHIPVTASIVDQQAALYGHGCRKPGDAKITFGTGAFALVITGDKPLQSTSQGLLPTVAWQFKNQNPVYALDGGVYSAGSAINWAYSLGLFKTYDEINQFSQPSAVENDLVFVPGLTGLGCPHWDRKAGGLWIGLSLNTQSDDLMQSILEGIVFRTAEVITAMNEFVSIKDDISIDGGLSANSYFCQFLADVLNRKVLVQSSSELTALGTAKLSMGNDIDIQLDLKDSLMRKYQPEIDKSFYLEKFKDAVKRSAKWRDQ